MLSPNNQYNGDLHYFCVIYCTQVFKLAEKRFIALRVTSKRYTISCYDDRAGKPRGVREGGTSKLKWSPELLGKCIRSVEFIFVCLLIEISSRKAEMNSILLARLSGNGRFLHRSGILQGKLLKYSYFLNGSGSYRSFNKPAVKGVIFDMGGVILPSPLPILTKFEQEYGLPVGTINDLVVKNYKTDDSKN